RPLHVDVRPRFELDGGRGWASDYRSSNSQQPGARRANRVRAGAFILANQHVLQLSIRPQHVEWASDHHSAMIDNTRLDNAMDSFLLLQKTFCSSSRFLSQ